MQSRYYNPTIGRFINADNYPSTGQGLLGNNMFAYCNNNPVVRQDSTGTAFETVFDIISLGASIADVAINPADPWAWIGLIGDIADVAIPCVGGLGEAVRALKAINAIDDSVDVIKITKNTLETISTAAHALSSGGEFVYLSYKEGMDGVLEYVGITNSFDRRRREWAGTRDIEKYVSGVDRNTARYAEQTVISLFGKDNNILSNRRNSIGKNGRLIDGYVDFFKSLF